MRWKPDLLTRLLAPYLFVLVAVAIALYAYSGRVVERLYVDTLSETVLQQAHLAGDLLPWDLRGPAMDQRCAAVASGAQARVTVIAADGTVLGDSDAPSLLLENHGGRPEVVQALQDGDGRDMRVSASVGRRLFYRAWRQSRTRDGQDELRIVRFAVPMTTIERARHRIRAAIWGGAAAAALAALLPAFVLSRRLSRRVSGLAEFSNAVTAGRPLPALAPEGNDIVSRLEANLITIAQSLRAQLAAAQGETNLLAAVLSGMVEGVLVIDAGSIIRLANQRAEHLFGAAPAGTLVGRPLIHVARDPDLLALVRDVTRSDTHGPLVRQITLPNGETLQVTGTLIPQPAGSRDLFVLVFHDITELKKLEATRRDFVANVSHELRTPLTAIRGYAETLQTGALNDPDLARKFLGVIERHSERLSRLTDDLLVLSDLELGRAPLQRAAVQLAHAVDAAIEVVRDKAGQAKVEIRTELPADLPALDADPDRVEQVLVNLIDNAVKYTPAGGRVTISARPAARGRGPAGAAAERDGAPENWIRISIADTGIGIPSHELPRLTERFYRVDKARSRELGGTGLGLAIVKHIVQAHGGAVRIESTVGRGTVVEVTFPAAGMGKA